MQGADQLCKVSSEKLFAPEYVWFAKTLLRCCIPLVGIEKNTTKWKQKIDLARIKVVTQLIF